MSNVTPAALAQLKAQGYRLELEVFGLPGSGKSRRAAARAEALKKAGRQVVVEDEIAGAGGMSGVRVWVKG